MRVGFAALLSHWRRHPLQLFTLLIGLALATALWSAVQAINAEARRSYAEASQLFGGGDQQFLTRRDGADIDIAVFVALRQAGWQVSPVIERPVLINGRQITLIGIDPVSANPGMVPIEMGRMLSETPTRILQLPGSGFAAPEFIADTLDSLPNDWPILEPSASIPPRTVIMDIGAVSKLAGPGLSRLTLAATQPQGRKALTDIAPDLQIETSAAANDLTQLTNSFHLNLTAFGLLSFGVGLFIVQASTGLAFEQRRPLVRTLRALGMPLSQVLTMMAAELLGLALIAGVAGVGLGYLIAGALLPDVAATLRGLYGAPVGNGLPFDPLWALAGLGMALIGAAAAAFGGLISIARMPLLASAQPRAWARQSRRVILVQAVCGIGLMGLGALSLPLIGGLVAGFAMLGGLLLGAALLLPAVLSVLLSQATRMARSVTAQWFWADTSQQLKGLSLALMALLLALATNVGVGTMVSSFRLTFTGWLDQRLVSELYITTRTNDEAAALEAWLTPRVDAVLPIWSVESRIAARPADVFGIIDHPTYSDNWPLLDQLPDVWERVHTDKIALVNEQLARRAGLSAGDMVTVEPGWDMTVGGVFSDYGNPNGQVIVSLDALLERHPDVPRLRYGVRIAPDRADDLRTELVEGFGLPAIQITDQASIKAFSLSVFEKTFSVTAALNILTLSVAGFAIFTSLLTLASLRLPQVAPVWALGLTRRRLSVLELGRSLVLAALTFVLAVPLGLVLAWILLSVVNVEAFGWQLPMFIFPVQWVWLWASAMIAALLASAWPVWRMSRLAPADFLRVFSNER